MKRLAIPVLLAFSLAGCASTSGGFGSTVFTQEVQQNAAKICSFVPTAQTVADIFLAGGTGIVSSALTIAAAICNAVTVNPLADGPGAKNYKPTVNGVRIRGKFIR